MDATPHLIEKLNPVAQWIGRSPEELAAQYEGAIAAHPVPEIREIPQQAYAASGGGQGFRKEWDLAVVPRVLALKIAVQATLGENWGASLEITPTVFEKELDTSRLEFSRTHSALTIHPAMLLAGADLEIGFFGSRLCFGITGDAWYYRPFEKVHNPITAKTEFCLQG
ncbi:hypothetical protein [Streptomyces celluloflavus]|uniref:hypothetical protein n=1 Tax=Streptomyces celluloflavus TaxID=58344 RepID=UPI0036D0A8DC